jgi:hypothetical protein
VLAFGANAILRLLERRAALAIRGEEQAPSSWPNIFSQRKM